MSEPVRSIDDLSPFELLKLMHQFFGGRRASEILGFSVVWGLVDASVGGREPADYRRLLLSIGWERTVAYRYLDDLSEFGDWLKQRNYESVETIALANRIAAIAKPVAHSLQ